MPRAKGIEHGHRAVTNVGSQQQVRCDAASLGVPCTNCVAFSIECKIPGPKRKKTAGKKEAEPYVLWFGPYIHTPSADARTQYGQERVV